MRSISPWVSVGRCNAGPQTAGDLFMRLAVISDVHVLGARELERSRVTVATLGNDLPVFRRSWRRGLNRFRDRFWNWEPEPRRDCFLRALEEVDHYNPDWVIANGDYGGDTLGVGISDESTYESAEAVVAMVRERFPVRSRFVFGDHDLGKYSTLLRQGGIRLASLDRGEQLGIRSFWHEQDKNFHLIGINSSLFGLDLFLPEALPGEIPEWHRRREQHIQLVCDAFDGLSARARVLLFCHDPSALAVLRRLPSVRRKMQQIERTILGHLHTPGLLALIKLLPKVPRLNPKYPVARINAQSLSDARTWRAFRPILCPSTFGAGHHMAGGALFAETSEAGQLVMRRHRISC